MHRKTSYHVIKMRLTHVHTVWRYAKLHAKLHVLLLPLSMLLGGSHWIGPYW